MKKLLTLCLLVLLAACTPTNEIDLNDTTHVIFQTYGGFVPQDRARQELVLTQDEMTYTIYAYNNSITYTSTKSFSGFQEVIDTLKSQGFDTMNTSYSSSALVTDVGVGELTVIIDGKNKTITVDPYYFEGVPDGVVNIFQVMQDLVNEATGQPEFLALQATNWLTYSPTYAYDGSDLELKEQYVLESYPEQYVFVFSFTSSHGGYGDRSEQMVTQVITNHTARITIVEGIITSAIIDDKWDELEQKAI